MSNEGEPPPVLSTKLCEKLGDKSYERRKIAAKDVEEIVRTAMAELGSQQTRSERVDKIISTLKQNFIDSPYPNSRKGGLIGLASVAIGLDAANIAPYLKDIILPIISRIQDEDPRVRYYAAEALYNVCKVAKGSVLAFLNELIDVLILIIGDSDSDIRNASLFLDRLLKDVVLEYSPDNVNELIPTFADKLPTPSSQVRQLCITWLTAILNMSSVNPLPYLRQFLSGLFGIYSDSKFDGRKDRESFDVRNSAQELLDQLLEFVLQANNSQMQVQAIEDSSEIIVDACLSNATESRKNGLKWISAFVTLSDKGCSDVLLRRPEQLAHLIGGVFICLAGPDDKIANTALEVHGALLAAVREAKLDGDIDNKDLVAHLVMVPLNCMCGRALIAAQPGEFDRSTHGPRLATTVVDSANNDMVRAACLQWINVLLERFPEEMTDHIGKLFNPVFDTLRNERVEVVMAALKVLAQISARGEVFDTVSKKILELFRKDRTMMEKKGRLVIRQLCGHLDVHQLFTRVAASLDSLSSDVEFCDDLVQTLNWILLTAKETAKFREELRAKYAIQPVPDTFPKIQNKDKNDESLFWQLLARWAHNPTSALSLCLFVEHYELSYAIVGRLAEYEPSVEILCQLDLLVQLLESPIFSRLRVQLLEPESHPVLVKTLLGLAMLLPQTEVFRSLSERLSLVQSAVPLRATNMSNILHECPKPPLGDSSLKLVLSHFDAVARQHRFLQRN